MNEVPNPDKFIWKPGDIQIIKLPDKKTKEKPQKQTGIMNKFTNPDKFTSKEDELIVLEMPKKKPKDEPPKQDNNK